MSTTGKIIGGQASAETQRALHEDRIERLNAVFYIRWTSGPDYERAFLCVEDGEPDMNSFAATSFGCARIFQAGMQALAALASPPEGRQDGGVAVKALDLLASLDPDALNPEQFNAYCALEAALAASPHVDAPQYTGEPMAYLVVTNNTAWAFHRTREEAEHGAKNRLTYVKGCTSAEIIPLYAAKADNEAARDNECGEAGE